MEIKMRLIYIQARSPLEKPYWHFVVVEVVRRKEKKRIEGTVLILVLLCDTCTLPP